MCWGQRGFFATICYVSHNLLLRWVRWVNISDLSTWVDGFDPSDPWPIANLSCVILPLYFTIATLGTSYAGSRKKLFLGCVISHWEEPRKRLSAGLCVLRFQFNWQNSAMHLWLQIIKKSRERKYLCQSATKSAALWFIALQFLRFRVPVMHAVSVPSVTPVEVQRKRLSAWQHNIVKSSCCLSLSSVYILYGEQ